MMRTPDSKTSSSKGKDITPESVKLDKTVTVRAGPSTEAADKASNVRRSIGEIEARASTSPLPALSQKSQSQPAGQTQPKKGAALPTAKSGSQRAGTVPSAEAEKSPKQPPKYKNRVAEAKACLLKAKLHLSNSRNLKTEIKTEVCQSVERLFNLVKESEEEKVEVIEIRTGTEEKREQKGTEERKRQELLPLPIEEMMKRMEENSKLLKNNSEEMERLTEMLRGQKECMERTTYASVAAGSPRRQNHQSTAMHSIIVASKDEGETGEQVFERVRRIVNAKEEGVRIDRIRKAKDRKIIIGCKDEKEIKKVQNRIAGQEELSVEAIKNKDPMIILFSVLNSLKDDEVIKAIRTQNGHLLKNITGDDDRMEVRFRRRARNPLTAHVVVRVSPRIWQSLTAAGAVHVDLQRVRVADQSPLIQCSRCLGYGHGRRFCHERVDVCSHCGGAHMKTDCPEHRIDALPTCTNCVKAKIGKADHNAFSSDCPVRRKWEALARSTVAYC